MQNGEKPKDESGAAWHSGGACKVTETEHLWIEMPDGVRLAARLWLPDTGGTVPVLAGRIQDRVPEDRPDLYPYGALDKLRRLYLEIGHASFPWVVKAALEFSGPSRLLFGTDFPVEPYETTTRHLPALGLPPDVLYALDRGNAERMFPKYRT